MENVETKESKVLMVRRAAEVVPVRREIREGKAQKATMAIPVTKAKHLQAPMEEEAETERTASRATKVSLETKAHEVIKAKQDLKATQADRAEKLDAAKMDLRERLAPEEIKVTLVSKVLGVIAVLTTRVLSDQEETRAKLERKALVVIQENLVAKAQKVLKVRKELRDQMVVTVQLANKVPEVLVDHPAPTAYLAASKLRKMKSDPMNSDKMKND